ncbi:MAG TPA: hypothetical protein VMA30_10345 [Xanthobacteraceae bacterium]|nr:hypothetical protein [Xanthobacteraceae bacterium]
MTITPFLSSQAFSPETVQTMSNVLLRACDRIGLVDRTDAAAQLVAEKIIFLAQTGVLEPEALLKRTLEEFNVRD